MRCGLTFTSPKLQFTNNVTAPTPTGGPVLLPGVYELQSARQPKMAAKSWSEQIVIGEGGTFARIRQVEISQLGKKTFATGTYVIQGDDITFSALCAQGEDDAGMVTDLQDMKTVKVKFTSERTGACDQTFTYFSGSTHFVFKRKL
jgi:hypothetical protein